MIREQIADLIADAVVEYKESNFVHSGQYADSILALPSGLESVSNCHTCEVALPIGYSICPDCHGTGKIICGLSIQEAIELCKILCSLKKRSKIRRKEENMAKKKGSKAPKMPMGGKCGK